MKIIHFEMGEVVNISICGMAEEEHTHPGNELCVPDDTVVGVGWQILDGEIIVPELAPLPEIAEDVVRSMRREAFAAYSDPIYFKWQRGEATEQDWLDAVEAIRAAYPYPESD